MYEYHEYVDGPLKGQAAVGIHINEKTLKWLKHASENTEYEISHLIEISVAKVALEYAKENGLLEKEL